MNSIANRNIWAISGILIFLFLQIVLNIPFSGMMNYLFIVVAMYSVAKQMVVGWQLRMSCVLLLLFSVLSILINDIPAIFKPWSRFALFGALFFALSPMVSNPEMCRVRRHLFMGILWGMGVLTIGSLLAYFAGVGLYMPGIVNSYMGLTSHANFLGFFAAITTVWVAALFFRATNMNERLLFIGLWGGCLLLLLLCASRSSLASAVIGSLVIIYLRNRQNLSSGMIIVGVVVGAIFFAWPVLEPYMGTMMKKEMDFENAENVIAASRGSIWDLRFAEIEQNPWFGVGAYACDTDLKDASIYYNKVTGTMEQGNSYLGLFAQVGCFGFLCFLWILVSALRKSWRYATREATPYAQFIFALLVTVSGHMLFEGYIMTAGAVQCVFLWALIGSADQCDMVADYPVAWEKNDPPTPEQYIMCKEWEERYG